MSTDFTKGSEMPTWQQKAASMAIARKCWRFWGNPKTQPHRQASQAKVAPTWSRPFTPATVNPASSNKSSPKYWNITKTSWRIRLIFVWSECSITFRDAWQIQQTRNRANLQHSADCRSLTSHSRPAGPASLDEWWCTESEKHTRSTSEICAPWRQS